MRVANSRIMRLVGSSLVLLVIMQAAEATAQNIHDGPPTETAQTSISDSSQPSNPKADGQDASASNAAQPASQSSAGSAQQEQYRAPAGDNNGAAGSSSEQQSSPAKPVGTAAAPALGSTGVAGSRPTGAVIAPAKQRRVRAILISVGVVVAACVAVGAVAALSHSSPSQPR